jgi:hypothetical protein
MRHSAVALLAVLFAVSCQDASDMGQPRTAMGVSFPVPVNSLTITALDMVGDSLLYANYAGQRLALPLSYTADETDFVIQQGQHTPDTLTVKHRNIPHFLSMEVGYTMYYELQSVAATRHAIDTVYILNPSITSGEQAHIAIQYPPAPADE